MNLSISNIAWNDNEETDVILLLKKMGIKGIEIAPTKIWSRPLEVPSTSAREYRYDWEKRGISLIAMQSLLFGQNKLKLFSEHELRRELLGYLKGIIYLAGQMGIKSLVFGSPKNRFAGSLSQIEQYEIAIPFFRELAEEAQKNNLVLCIEPNPPQYGCDFITNTDEAVSLINRVQHPGFQLHLDAGALILNDENISNAIEIGMPVLSHFHISEPFLNVIGSEDKSHKEISKQLKGCGYKGWVSIEMKNNIAEGNVENVEKALTYAIEVYS